MFVEYTRDLSHNYMLIREEGEAPADTYDLRILMSNRIPGILPMEMEEADGQTRYRYEITSCQPFERFCSGRTMTADLLRRIYSNLLDCLITFEDFLLDSSHLLLDFEYLYLKLEESALQIPYVPTYSKDIRQAMISFTEAVIMQISHGRQDSIVLACRILHELQSKEMQLMQLREFLLSGELLSADPGALDEARLNQAGGYESGQYENDDQGYVSPGKQENPVRTENSGSRSQVRINHASNSISNSASKNIFKNTSNSTSKSTFNNTSEEEEFRPLYAVGEEKKKPLRKAKRRGKHSASKAEMEAVSEKVEKRGLSTAIQKQIPERDTVRMALTAAVPAALIFVILQVQTVYLLSTREVVGISLLTAAGILFVLCLMERKNKKRLLAQDSIEDISFGNDFGDVPGLNELNDLSGTDGLSGVNHTSAMSGMSGFDGMSGMNGKGRLDGMSGMSGISAHDGMDGMNGIDAHGGMGGANGIGAHDGLGSRSGLVEPCCVTTVLCAPQGKREGVCPKLIPSDPSSAVPPITIRKREVIIGKQPSLVDVVVSSDTVSRIHARIYEKDGSYYINDMGSKNGTFVDGKPVVGREEVLLTEGVQVSLADINYTFTSI